MLILDKIIDQARSQQKNILIMGSARSGTHALGQEMALISNGINLGEICAVLEKPEPWNEIQKLYNTKHLTIAHVVQLTSKLFLARDVETIKKHTVIVKIRRRDKVKQFASYIYFRIMDPTALHGWHNHTASKTKVQPNSVIATDEQINQFMLEQMLDDYFVPDYNLCYDDIVFKQSFYKKNDFGFPIETMFSNLNYVRSILGQWKYCQEHFKNEQ